MLTDNVSDVVISAQAGALVALLNSGYMNIYDGQQPTTSNQGITKQRLLSSLRFGSPAAPSAINGVITFSQLTGVVTAPGIASWYRCFAQDGTTVIMDGSVGVRGQQRGGELSKFNLELNNDNFLLSARVTVDDFKHTVQRGTDELSNGTRARA